MSELPRRSEEFRACPHLTDEQIQAVNQSFPGYLFYVTLKNGDRECWCSSCNTHFTHHIFERTQDWRHGEILNAKHNEEVQCPRCFERVTMKNRGTANTAKNLYQERLIAQFFQVDYSKVYVRVFFASKDYQSSGTKQDPYPNNPIPRLQIWDAAIYMLTQGEAVLWRRHWGVWCMEDSPFYEPVNMGSAGNMPYWVFGFGCMNTTFLKYSQYNLFENALGTWNRAGLMSGVVKIPMMKYLTNYSVHPQLEMLAKLRHWDVVRSQVLENRPNKRLLDWDANNPPAFFKLTKQEYKAFDAAGGTLPLLKLYRYFKKKKVPRSFAECGTLINALDADYCYELIDLTIEYDLNFTHICNYIKKQSEKIKGSEGKWRVAFAQWRDYLQNAKKLGYDLKNETVLIPKNLKKAHDDAVKNVEWQEERDKAEFMKNLQPSRIKMYHYENDEFIIRTPDSMQEIIDEGKALSHCVGGYAARHAEGKLTILFMRRKDAPETPLYTIEMDIRKLKQVHGKNNCLIKTAGEKAFFEEWTAWVASGSKKKQIKERVRVSA